MNDVIYKLLNKTNGYKELSEDNFNELYNYFNMYINRLKELNISSDHNISDEELYKIFRKSYDVLRFRVSDSEFKKICENYITLLVADIYDGFNVNLEWAVQHLYYLVVGLSNSNIDTERYSDCIVYIQDKLMNEFTIQETWKKKLARRFYTGFVVR
ncbi:MAG: hypothetical protein IJ574_03960 [Bacilli bacterium]|nr:hypothetical protein [Bacilli bacterium]